MDNPRDGCPVGVGTDRKVIVSPGRRRPQNWLCGLVPSSMHFFLAHFITRDAEDVYEDTHIINADNSLIYEPANRY